MNQAKGTGAAFFAGVLLMVGGVLSIVYGIAAISNSNFFAHDAHFVFGSLKTWGWIALIIGILEIIASASVFGGGTFGRWFGIGAGAVAAIDALLEIPAYPFWSLAIFALSLWIIHGLATYGGPSGDIDEFSSSYASAAGQASVPPRPPV
jgi:hypothetical protein